jgi:short subunit dehydrogenase-like uncharacterized protein
MSTRYDLIIFGSYGYTGSIIVDHCRKKQLKVLLSGRNAAKLKAQSEESGYPFLVADVNDHEALVSLLKQGILVIHCAGPFQFTAKQMVTACLEAGTHYTDITGEYMVFELMAGYDAIAKSKNIIIIPGVGFDVVPSDCLALHLRNKLPSATHLQLAFAQSNGQLSRGTALTAVEGLGHGTVTRVNGKLVESPLGAKILNINFGQFIRTALCIPWGDVSTAYRSTGIPNIEVYTGMSPKAVRFAKFSKWLNWLLRKENVRKFLRKKINSGAAGPDKERREQGRSFFWGKVWDDHGAVAEARLETMSGYELTATTAVLIAGKIVNGDVRPGSYTPAEYFGPDLILEAPNTTRK